ncbi:MAG: hypothetical protein HKO81_06875 [Flavobacteriaceae bacterium]|nr:hypothetical protein [Bacteroidia bacterium]NNL16347.1 hypothetical protein [Flavobacteriaceae bacterium]
MKNKVIFWVTLIGILIGAISYWRIPYDEMNLSEINLWLFVGAGTLIGSLFSTLLFNLKPWKVGLLITLGVILAVIIRIIYDVTFFDSTSHNLAPFEVIFSGLQSLPTALIGAYLAKGVQNFKK